MEGVSFGLIGRFSVMSGGGWWLELAGVGIEGNGGIDIDRGGERVYSNDVNIGITSHPPMTRLISPSLHCFGWEAWDSGV